MERDHQIFIGRDDPGGCLAGPGGDHWTARGVAPFVDFKPEPASLLANTPPDVRGVLADTRRKD